MLTYLDKSDPLKPAGRVSFCGTFELYEPEPVQHDHQRRYEGELYYDARDGVEERSRHKRLPRKRVAGYTEQDHFGGAPYDAPREHGCYDREVKSGDALLFRTVIKESRHEAVSCELECHGSGDRIQRGHSEDKRAHDGENRTDRETVLPAADKSAEKHRNVHGEQHIAYLRYAAGDHGQYHTERRKHCGESQVFYLLFHFAPRFFIWPSPRLPLHDGRRCVPSRL